MSKEMTFAEYEKQAAETRIYPSRVQIIYPALKLSGEAGEVAEKVGKVLRDNRGVFSDEKKAELALEVSDCLWYCAAIAADLGYTLEGIAKMNIAKLSSRKERGVLGGSGDNR